MAGLVHGSIDMDPLERKFLTSNVMKDDDDDDLRGHDSGDSNHCDVCADQPSSAAATASGPRISDSSPTQ